MVMLATGKPAGTRETCQWRMLWLYSMEVDGGDS